MSLPGNYDDDATLRALRQTIVLTAAMVVAVDQSVKQAATNFTYVIKATNTHVPNMSHHVIYYQHVSISFVTTIGSITRVLRIE
jgi:hypothetical protein